MAAVCRDVRHSCTLYVERTERKHRAGSCLPERDMTLNQTRPTALIFRMRLLPFSETFIQSQANAMRTFRPFFIGLRKVKGLDVSDESAWIANRGGVSGWARELRFRMWGPSAGCTQQFRRMQPKICAHFGPDACEAIQLAKRLRIPLIATFHGYDATLTDAALANSRHGRSYLRNRAPLHGGVSQFLAVSQFIQKRIQQQGYPADRILVHYIGVDTKIFRPPESDKRTKQVLFVGRLVPKKGCSFLIKAMSLVQEVLPELELIVIGDGAERTTLAAEAHRSLRRYRFLGAQTPSAIQGWMQSASLFCVPSVTASNGDAEGFGMVFAEAQASGLPVVSFVSGGIPEAVSHGQTGFLAPEGNWRKLAEYIVLLQRNATLWEQFSRNGRRLVERHFNLSMQTAKLE